ncbi:MAG: 6-bladed beta-propeller [bacterium]
MKKNTVLIAKFAIALFIFSVFTFSCTRIISSWQYTDTPAQISDYPITPGYTSPYKAKLDFAGRVNVLYKTGAANTNSVTFYNSLISSYSSFAPFGSDPGDVVDPSGFDKLANGRYVIADSGAGKHNIQIYSPFGLYLSSFGSQGSLNSEFESPKGITHDTSNNIYIADSGNNRIQKFTSAGVFIGAFGSLGNGSMEFNNPVDVAYYNGLLFVVDQNNDRIQIFDATTFEFQVQLGSSGSNVSELTQPSSIAIAGNTGLIIIGDKGNSRIQAFGFNTGQWHWVSGTNTADTGSVVVGEYNDISGISIDYDNYEILVTDVGTNRITKYTLDIYGPTVSIDALSNYYYQTPPSVTGTATDNLSNISTVEYEVDHDGNWYPCEPQDGTFDNITENYICYISLSLADGIHAVHTRSIDSYTNTSTTNATRSFYIDTVLPTLTLDENPVGWALTKVISVTAHDNTNLPNAFCSNDGVTFTGTGSYCEKMYASLGDFWYYASDQAGNTSDVQYFAVIDADNYGPSQPMFDTTRFTTSTPTLTWTESIDLDSGLADPPYYLSWCKWVADQCENNEIVSDTAATNSYMMTTPLSEGFWKLWIRAYDKMGNYEPSTEMLNVLDLSAPLIDATVSPDWAKSKIATASAIDNVIGFGNTTCEAVTSTETNSGSDQCQLTFNTNDDMHYFACDAADNCSAEQNLVVDKIDNEAPSIPGSPQQISPLTSNLPQLEWDGSIDQGSGLADPGYEIQWCQQNDFSDCESNKLLLSSTSYTFSDPLAEGNWYVQVNSRDILDNISSNAQANFIIDNTPPTGSIVIANGAETTSSTNVTLTLTAVDSSSGINKMMICNVEDFSGCSYENYAISKSWTLVSGLGLKTVYVKYLDGADLESSSYNDTITLIAAPINPTVTSTPITVIHNTLVPTITTTISTTVIPTETVIPTTLITITPKITTINPILTNLPTTGEENNNKSSILSSFGNLNTIGIIGSVSIFLASSVLSSMTYSTFSLLSFPWFLKTRSKKKWGIIYDNNTNEPIPFARISLIDKNTGEILQTAISDLQGKYGFPFTKGNYLLQVAHSKYLLNTKTISLINESIVALDFALTASANKSEFEFQQFLTENGYKLNTILFGIGFLLAFLAFIYNQNILSFLILLIYFIFIAFNSYKLLIERGNSWGHVQESNTNRRLAGVFVRIFSIKENQQIDVQMSDQEGRFSFKLEPGKYMVLADKKGLAIDYSCYSSNELFESPAKVKFLTYQVDKTGNIKLIIRMRKVI